MNVRRGVKVNKGRGSSEWGREGVRKGGVKA